MYSGLKDQTRWVLPEVLTEQAARRPDSSWIETTDGATLTFGEAAADMDRVAGWFAALGVRSGEPVAVLLPNGLDFVRVWLGLTRLGATAVLLNPELRGAFLRHQLVNCDASVAVVDRSLLAAVDEIGADLAGLGRVVVAGGSPHRASGGWEIIDWGRWRDAVPTGLPLPSPRDIACIMYTSGTSGPSKGVLMPHAHCYLYGLGAVLTLQLGLEDRYYIVLPLFHANGLLMQLAATLIAGCVAILRSRFSASAWLEDIRTHRATVTNSLGALAAFVVARPPTDLDRDHPLRAILSAPNLPAHEEAFRDRFGVRDVVSGYGMTEVNIPVWGRVGRSLPGAAGHVSSEYFELIVADPETDRALPPDTLGEILVRPRVPFGFMAGYHRMPDRTVEAWRNLWFHTGDAGTMTADGVLYFVDRIKDCIRRRGENISAAEVELAVGSCPGVREIVALAVPSDVPGGEDEVFLVVVPDGDSTGLLARVAEHADRVLPRYARPRYLELAGELPRTATGKVQRAVLRQRGAKDAWDREIGSGRRGAVLT